MNASVQQKRTSGHYYREATVAIKPDLHVSESTAVIKAERFLRNAAQEILDRHARMNIVEDRIRTHYRKPLTQFRALCKDPSLADVIHIVEDTPKQLTALRLFHTEDRRNGYAYFYLVHFRVTNKRMRMRPLNKPVDISITAHALARLLERSPTSVTLDVRGICLMLTRLLGDASGANYDEKGRTYLRLEQFPNTVFVCCKDRWRDRPDELAANYSIVTYMEK
ncbi:MAG TPA: hypothetical protein VM553_06520 [Dongiaceae bacterium]|nr:hypothetical protein [Dongiaceae bacterium]